MPTGTRPKPQAFPRVQKILARPGIFTVPLIVFTELGLANPQLGRALTHGNYYDRIARALCKYTKVEALGLTGAWPRMLNTHPDITERFIDSLHRLIQVYDNTVLPNSNEQQLNALDSRELWRFTNHLAARRNLPTVPDTYTRLRRTVDALAPCFRDGYHFSDDGPALFWDMLQTKEAKAVLGLPDDPKQRFRIVTRAAERASAALHVQLFAKYKAEGLLRTS